MMSSDFMPVTSIASVFLKPTPSDMTWKPPESVNVGPSQFMKRARPPGRVQHVLAGTLE